MASEPTGEGRRKGRRHFMIYSSGVLWETTLVSSPPLPPLDTLPPPPSFFLLLPLRAALCVPKLVKPRRMREGGRKSPISSQWLVSAAGMSEERACPCKNLQPRRDFPSNKSFPLQSVSRKKETLPKLFWEAAKKIMLLSGVRLISGSGRMSRTLLFWLLTVGCSLACSPFPPPLVFCSPLPPLPSPADGFGPGRRFFAPTAFPSFLAFTSQFLP